MSDALRIRIAAAITALFIGALSAAGVAVRSRGPSHTKAVAAHAAPAQLPVEDFGELDDE